MWKCLYCSKRKVHLEIMWRKGINYFCKNWEGTRRQVKGIALHNVDCWKIILLAVDFSNSSNQLRSCDYFLDDLMDLKLAAWWSFPCVLCGDGQSSVAAQSRAIGRRLASASQSQWRCWHAEHPLLDLDGQQAKCATHFTAVLGGNLEII